MFMARCAEDMRKLWVYGSSHRCIKMMGSLCPSVGVLYRYLGPNLNYVSQKHWLEEH